MTPDYIGPPTLSSIRQQQFGTGDGECAIAAAKSAGVNSTATDNNVANEEEEPKSVGVGDTALSTKITDLEVDETKEEMRKILRNQNNGASSQINDHKKMGRLNSLHTTRWQPPSSSLQRKQKRNSEFEVNDHPSKMIKTERDGRSMKSLTSILTVPSWMKQQSRKQTLRGELLNSYMQTSHTYPVF